MRSIIRLVFILLVVLFVVSNVEAQSVITKFISLKHIKAVDIAELIQPQLTKEIGSFTMDETLNAITVTDTRKSVLAVENLVQRLDRETSIALSVDVHIVQVMLNDENQKGVDWRGIVSQYKDLDVDKLKSRDKKLSLGVVDQEDLDLLIEALETVGIVKDVSKDYTGASFNKPLYLSIRPLEVFLSSDDLDVSEYQSSEDKAFLSIFPILGQLDNTFSFYVKTDAKLAESTGVIPSAYIDTSRFQRVGSRFKSLVSFIAMRKRKKQEFRKDQEGFVYDSEGSIVTQKVFSSNVSSVSNLEENMTIVVGGLFKDVVVDSTQKIPWLGDIPYLGYVFRNDGQRIRKSEIIIFLTPRVKK